MQTRRNPVPRIGAVIRSGLIAVAGGLVALSATAQQPGEPSPVAPYNPTAAPVSLPELPPGYANTNTNTSTGESAPAPAAAPIPILPPGLQVVRFTAPEGVRVEVIAPTPEMVPQGDGQGTTVGLRTGTTYWLRVSNLPGHAGAVLYPTIEMVGHLHRPNTIDPGKFPIRVPITAEAIDEARARSRMTTEVVYLEDPEQALPLAFPKDEIPSLDLLPTADPLKIAASLGRVMAILRIGGRVPDAEELSRAPGQSPLLRGPCPFVASGPACCPVPMGPACGTPPPQGQGKLWFPRDEYLCDGGDHHAKARVGGSGGLGGIDPKDAVVRFARPGLETLLPEFDKVRERYERGEISAETYGIEVRRLQRWSEGDRSPRVLPTNVICLYAPRFACVRQSSGPNENLRIEPLAGAERVIRQQQAIHRDEPVKLTRNEPPALNRGRSRAAIEHQRQAIRTAHEVRVLQGFDVTRIPAGMKQVVGPETQTLTIAPGKIRTAESAVALKLAEGVEIRGKVAGAGETLMAWKPQETAGVETPPNQPGLAVIKRADTSVAEPGQKVKFTIQYRNMGNVPLSDVSIVDSLLARFAYVAGSAVGPQGTVFTAVENRAGSVELRWDLPGLVEPGAEGWVAFDVEVR